MNNRPHYLRQDCPCVHCATLPAAYPHERIAYTFNNPRALATGILALPIPSIMPYLRPVTYNGQPVRVLLPGNQTPGAPALLFFNSPPAIEEPVVRGPARLFRVPPLQDTQSVHREAPKVPARRPGKATGDDIDHTDLNVQLISMRDNHQGSSATLPLSRKVSPTFILRYEHASSIVEYQVEGLNIMKDPRAVWEALLYRALTPSAYEVVQDEFGLKLWRHPHWVSKTVCWNLGESAVANLKAIVDQLVSGDVLWIYPPDKRRHAS